MASAEPLRIFISYSRKDGAVLAQRLQCDLAKQGFDAWLDTKRIGGGAVWSAEIEREIDACQVMIALLSPGSYKSEICRAEQIRALDKGKRVIPVIAVKGADRPLYLYARQYRDFTEDTHYVERLGELLADIRGDSTATLPDNYRKTRVTYLTAPPRVANYLERPEALHALRDTLFTEDDRQPIALTALAGMGGIGKTVLAKALTQDEVVLRAFPDGIVWVTAGKERKRDFIEEMREVAKALGDDLSAYDTTLACENQYRSTIANKAALIVVDDVWSKADIEPLLAESPRSRFLFTTRDASIGRFVSAHEHRADLLDVAQSRQLLASWAHVPIAELPAAGDELITECGRLPLALSVVGAMLRGAPDKFWLDTLQLMREADLSAIQEQLPPGQDSFFKAVEVSFQSLKPDMRQRYKSMAVLLEDMAAPLPILETLWNVNEAEARRISRQLVDRSLAQPDGAEESIRLHDLQLDYVRAQYPDREALELIRGAVRLSSHVIGRDPTQFASQLVGRLLPCQDLTAVQEFTRSLIDGARPPWLKPLTAALTPPGGPLLRVLAGHRGVAAGVVLTPDGAHAVSASYDRTLRVWNIATGNLTRTLIGHQAQVSAVAVTPDGCRAVSASYDKSLKVWDLSDGRELCSLRGHADTVRAVAIAPDGRTAISGCADGTVGFWDLASGTCKAITKVHNGLVSAVAITPDGRRLISASTDGSISVWDFASRGKLLTLEAHKAEVRTIAVSPKGDRLVSASADRTLKIFDLATGEELRTLAGHAGDINGLAITRDGRYIVSASWDSTLRVWDLPSGRHLQTLEGPCPAVLGVAVTPDMSKAVTTCLDGTLHVWRLSFDDHTPVERASHRGSVRDIAISLDGRSVISASSDATLKVWDLERRQVLRTLTGHTGTVLAVAISADGSRAVSGSLDGTLRLWDLTLGRELKVLLRLERILVGTVAITPDGRRAISAGDKVRVWDVETERLSWTGEGPRSAVIKVGLTDDKCLVSLYANGCLGVWDLVSGAPLRLLFTRASFSQAMSLVSPGKALVGCADAVLRLFDLKFGREITRMPGHASRIASVAVTSDGKLAISGSDDATLRAWDVETGRALAVFTADSGVWACAIAPDGQTIVAGDASGRIHFLKLVRP
jgi:WD40 repeat protein